MNGDSLRYEVIIYWSDRAVIRDLSFGLPISPLVLTPEEIRQRLAAGDPFIREILETGVER